MIRKFINCTAIICSSLLFFACNRNSNELPAPPVIPAPVPATPADTINVQVAAGNGGLLSAKLVQKPDSPAAGVKLILSNTSGQDITNLVLLLETYPGKNENYNDANIQRVFGPLTVRAVADTAVQVFLPNGMRIKDSLSNTIAVHIIHYNNSVQPYAGVYGGVGGYAHFIVADTGADAAKNYFGYAKGYIPLLEPSIFWLLAKNTPYTITASFGAANQPLPGVIAIGDTSLVPYVIDSLTVSGQKVAIDTAGGIYHVRMALKQKLADSVAAIELYLNKN